MPWPPTAGATYNLIFEVAAQLTLYVNGTLCASATANTFATGKASLHPAHLSTATTGIHIDNGRVTRLW